LPPRKITVNGSSQYRSSDLFRAAIIASALFFILVSLDNIDFSVSDTPLTEEKPPKDPVIDEFPEQELPETVPDVSVPEEIPESDIPEEIPENITEEKPEEVPEEEPQRIRLEDSVKIITEFLSVAIEQEGYYHDGANTKFTGNFDYNGPDEWSAEFLTWCVASIGETLSVQLGGDMFPWSDSVTDCFLWFISHEQFDDSGEFTPWGGDYVFLDLDTDGLIDRVGVVTETKVISTLDLYGNEKRKTIISVICGNMPKSKKIELFEIDVTDQTISGFGIIE